MVRRASMKDATDNRAPTGTAPPQRNALVPLTSIATNQWRELSEHACEPNGYYLPGWELAVNAFAHGRTGASALAAWNGDRLIGLMPVVSMWHAYKIPLPALVSAHPYGTLCTPPLDRTMALEAAAQLLREARDAGAHALILRDMPLDGAVMNVFGDVLRRDRMRPRVLQSNLRACLDATRDAEELLREALSAKKLKELRRQRHRLAEHGAVQFEVARSPDQVAAAAVGCADDSGNAPDAGIAARLFERFVVTSEIVDVEQHQADLVGIALGQHPIPLQQLFEVGPGMQAGQAVFPQPGR